jgi:hypothetical protein
MKKGKQGGHEKKRENLFALDFREITQAVHYQN